MALINGVAVYSMKKCFLCLITLSSLIFIYSYFSYTLAQATIISDDFSASNLNTTIWTYNDPIGDATQIMTGTGLSISVPAGTSHDVWQNGNFAPRVMQSANNADFEIEVKYESAVSAQYQMQGIIIEENSNNYLRFDFYSDNSNTRIFAASFNNGFPTVRTNTIISSVPGNIPLFMRVKRQGSQWTQSYSTNGVNWTTSVIFTHSLTVTSVGLFAGNCGFPACGSTQPPSFASIVDYFFNTASPINPEDGGITTPSVIDIWYGDNQRFGQHGNPQQWINILGNVSDPNGISSLKYSLNNGHELPLTIGPDGLRLQSTGDFNIEIAYTDLICGINQVEITAINNLNDTTVKTVSVEYTCGNTWPKTYSTDWSTVTNIQDVAQVVDGKWSLGTSGVRPVIQGYDRLIAIGDITWDDFEMRVSITIHDINTSTPHGGPFLGCVIRWQGHYDWDGAQPRKGWWPLGAFMGYDWISNLGYFRLHIAGNNSVTIAQDTTGKQLTTNVRYIFKMRVETTGSNSIYSLKAWEDGTSEPSQWDVSGTGLLGELHEGSLLLLAHFVDASFGNITITPGPFNDTTPLNSAPVADAGTDQSANVGSLITLDGSASFDPDGDPLTYSWSFTSQPTNSLATLNDPAAARPTFTADVAGIYVASLKINDGTVDSTPASVTISAIARQTTAISLIQDAINALNELDSGVFNNPGNKKTLISKLNTSIEKFEKGDYENALKILKNDVLKKMDGCAANGEPDKGDWITDCDAQASVYFLIQEAIALIRQRI